jgi:hypothetical protein
MPIQLQDHQQATLDYFIKSPNRGLLLLHSTGSGKTLTAIAIAEHLKYYRDCIIIAPKSLHDNFRKGLKQYGTRDENRYRYVSSNASNMIDKLETTTDELTGTDIKTLQLDNKLIILDEWHNLGVGMSNGSSRASALYDMLMKAKNCRIIAMTASGIINNIYEAAIILNICKGPIRTEDGEWSTLLPESSEEFSRYFIDEKTYSIRNENKLRNRITGLVSYKGDLFERSVLSFYPMLNTVIKKELYPDRLPIKIEAIRMSSQQWGAYEQAREKERLETRNAIVGSGWVKGNPIILGGELKHSSAFGKSTSYRVKSRQLSNVYQPDGSIDINSDIATYAPKIKSIADKIRPGVKSIVYSNFVQAGVNAMASYLDHVGYKRYDPNNKSGGDEVIHGYYGVFSGEVSQDDRTATLEYYNQQNSPLTILLISSSGAEGISTKGTRNIFIMDMHWNWERSLQVMARGIRYRSHEGLPESERNVQVRIYIAVPPKDVKPIEKTTDAYLLTECAKKYDIAQAGIRLMASVSIECPRFNTGVNLDCHKCDPGSSPLYLNDLHKDMLYPLPCKADAKPVDAKEIQLNGSLFYVTDAGRVFTQSTNGEYHEILDMDIKDWVLSRMPN